MECAHVLLFLGLLKVLVFSDIPPCHRDWKEIDNECMQVVQGNFTWNEALAMCNASKTKLVDINEIDLIGLFNSRTYIETTQLVRCFSGNSTESCPENHICSETVCKATCSQKNEQDTCKQNQLCDGNLCQGIPSHFWVQDSAKTETGECPYFSVDFPQLRIEFQSCNSTIGYICQKNLEFFRRHREVTQLAGVQTCQYAMLFVQRGNSCYWAQEKSTRDAVEEACRAKGGHLVEIKDSEEEFRDFFHWENVFWLGLKRAGNHLVWENGRIHNESTAPWSPGQPATGTGDCVLAFKFYNTNGGISIMLEMEYCSNIYPGLCEANIQPATTPSTYLQPATTPVTSTTPEPQFCPPDWNELNSSDCIWISPEGFPLTWEESQSFCESIGGNLLYYDEVDAPSLRKYFTKKYYSSWIGLKYNLTSEDFEWKWSTGFSSSYRNWRGNAPGNLRRNFCISLEISVFVPLHWVNQYCSSLKTFLCRASKSSARPALFEPTQEPRSARPALFEPTQEPLISCGPEAKDWFLHEDYCYKFVSQKLSWNSAERYCQGNGGHLASVHSSDDTGFLIRMFHQSKINQRLRIWLGLNALGLDGVFQWSDGSTVNYGYWTKGEPNYFMKQEKCVSIYINSAMWNDENCSSKKEFLCKRYNEVVTSPTEAPPTTPLPGNCPAGWKPFGNKCYLAVGRKEEDRVSWKIALQRCLSQGSELVSVHSEKEQNFLKLLLLSIRTRAWIGLHDTIIESQFYWSDNSDVDFTFWDTAKPKEGSILHDCVEMNYGFRKNYLGRWNNIYCEEKRAYICHRYKDPYISTPSSEEPTCDNPKGWTMSDYGCYKIFSSTGEESSWLRAETICRQYGGHLVTVRDEGANTILKYMSMSMSRLFWIGLKENVHNEFKWVSGLRFTYADWGKHEPNVNVPGKACVGMSCNGQWRTSGCNERRPFACEVTSVVPTLPTQNEGFCPTDFEGWRDFGGDNCYTIETEELTTWSIASHRCFQQGGTLASIHSQLEVDVLAAYLNKRKNTVWIGLSKKYNGGFTWTDGSPVNYANWKINKPSDPNERCTEISRDSKKWIDQPCSMLRGYICMTKKVILPTLPTQNEGVCRRDFQGWRDFGGDNCYIIETEKLTTWSIASQQCFQQGGTLASIHSQHEVDVLTMYLKGSKNSVWIGLTRKHNGVFAWTDGSPVNYVNWDDKKPNNPKEHCTEMYSDSGKWNDYYCSMLCGYICMTKKVALNNTVTGYRGYRSSEESSRLSSGAIAGVVIGSLLVAVLGITVAITFLCRKAKVTSLLAPTPSVSMHFENAMFTRHPLGDEGENGQLPDSETNALQHPV